MVKLLRVLALAVAVIMLAESFILRGGADGENEWNGEEGFSEESVEEVISRGFYSFRDSIDISAYSVLPRDLGAIFSAVIKDDPYLFFVDRNLSYSYQPGGYVLTLRPRYLMMGEEVFDAWDVCRDFVREAAKEAMTYGGGVRTALYLHDLVCERFSYDESLSNDGIFAMITTGRGTCQGYTQLYNALLRECGIDSHFVASDTIAHIWNYLLIDGEWYHADLTWDDAGDEVIHRHFLLSDRAALERGHKDWYSPIDVECASDKYIDADAALLLHGRFDRGDVDHNYEIDLRDLLLIRTQDSEACPYCMDMNSDGAVDGSDLNNLRGDIIGSHIIE